MRSRPTWFRFTGDSDEDSDTDPGGDSDSRAPEPDERVGERAGVAVAGK